MREGIAQIMPGYSVMREYPRTLKHFEYAKRTSDENHKHSASYS